MRAFVRFTGAIQVARSSVRGRSEQSGFDAPGPARYLQWIKLEKSPPEDRAPNDPPI
jgi:hypothetical protein